MRQLIIFINTWILATFTDARCKRRYLNIDNIYANFSTVEGLALRLLFCLDRKLYVSYCQSKAENATAEAPHLLCPVNTFELKKENVRVPNFTHLNFFDATYIKTSVV